MKSLGSLTISDLSKVTGVSVASVKFYLREKLLAVGDLARKHRAYYGAEHVERLRLIRTLREVGGISVSGIRAIVDALDTKNTRTLTLVARTLDAFASADDSSPGSAPSPKEIADLRRFLASRGIETRATSHALMELTRTLSVIRDISREDIPLESLEPYVKVAREIAKVETDAELLTGDPQTMLRRAVLGTILWERVLLSLRRILHEHLAVEVFKNHAADTTVVAKSQPNRKPRAKTE